MASSGELAAGHELGRAAKILMVQALMPAAQRASLREDQAEDEQLASAEAAESGRSTCPCITGVAFQVCCVFAALCVDVFLLFGKGNFGLDDVQITEWR